MAKRAALLLLLLVTLYGVSIAMGYYREEEEEDWRREKEKEEEEECQEERREGRGRRGGKRGEDWFLLHDFKRVVKTDAGDMRVGRKLGGRAIDRPMHIGFITMEPKTLFIPQYVDSNLIIFIRRGEAKIGLIYRDELAERQLKIGDIYRIPAGSAFYLVNTGEGQRLHVICSIDPSESLGIGAFQSFFIGGGTNPRSVLSGFEPETLAIAFNVTLEELKDVMRSQSEGPIVFIKDSSSPRTRGSSVWTKFLQLKDQDRLNHLKRMVESQQEPVEEEEEQKSWSWRKLLRSMLGEEKSRENEKHGKCPDSYNMYERNPDFRNNYGWSIALDEDDYDPLKHSGIGVYLVNLTAGSMMAPHVNPKATEYGIVLRGSGTIQIVYPNGTQAMNAKVTQGDVFWVPRYFPFCQIASKEGPLEFFGFTTSASKNRPQFLAGASSVLKALRGPELAAAFGVDEDVVRRFVDAQHKAIILPLVQVSPLDKVVKKQKKEKAKFKKVPKVIKRSIENDMLMGF